jgi:nucleotide-binding universal stress UspA family protein
VTLLCATDFSGPAAVAEAQALHLALALGAELVFLHVALETPLYREGPFSMADVKDVYDAQRRWAADQLRARVRIAEGGGVRARSVIAAGTPAAEIVRTAAEEKARLIVMGTHGRTGLDRLLLGSVAERVIRRAPCPVVTVRPNEDR